MSGLNQNRLMLSLGIALAMILPFTLIPLGSRADGVGVCVRAALGNPASGLIFRTVATLNQGVDQVVSGIWKGVTFKFLRADKAENAFSKFRWESFDNAKMEYQRLFELARNDSKLIGQNLEKLPKTLEEKMAMIEALGEYRRAESGLLLDEAGSALSRGTDGIREIIDGTSTAARTQRQELFKLASQMDFSKGLADQNKIMDWGRQLYKAENLPPESQSLLRRQGVGAAADDWIDQRIGQELFGETDVLKAFQNLGMVGKPKGIGKNPLKWLGKYFTVRSEKIRAIIWNPELVARVFAKVDLPTMDTVRALTGMDIPFLYAPASNLTQFRKIPPELLTRIGEEGMEAVKPALRAHFKEMGTAHFDVVYNVLQSVYTKMMLAELAYIGGQLVIHGKDAMEARWAEAAQQREQFDNLLQNGINTQTPEDVRRDNIESRPSGIPDSMMEDVLRRQKEILEKEKQNKTGTGK